MMRFFLVTLFLSFLFLCINPVQAQKKTPPITETREQLQQKQVSLQREIDDLNNTLKIIRNSRQQSIAAISSVLRKIQLRKQLIRNTKNELRKISDTIYITNLEIIKTQNELDTLKKNYVQSLMSTYEHRISFNYLYFILSAHSFNDAFKRLVYYKKFCQFREQQLDAIVRKQEELKNQVLVLADAKIAQSNALIDQNKQLSLLNDDVKEENQIISKLKSKETVIGRQIRTKQSQRLKLQKMVANIIKREAIAQAKLEANRKRQMVLKKSKSKKNAPNVEESDNASGSGDNREAVSSFDATEEGRQQSMQFKAAFGRLPWPVEHKGYISLHYGNYNIPDTHLKGYSEGIEMALPDATPVKSIADGVVSFAGESGDGKVVLVRSGRYFVSYSHLSKFTIKQGATISTGSVLGYAGKESDQSNYILFLMITDDKGHPFDPEKWLQPR
ncbi:MAG: peptidoglycan DD-metalloendopeptidase family protein [Phycisphaerales bacterium]|nr:peptidoglycan DD-metalloendopeptidase family protein [Phycisphaerales bacterium]